MWWFTALVLNKLMILIFFFQSNKHWHENGPQAETSNEKMKLVFQLTDQKHFIHNNQAFIWVLDLWACVCVCVCVCVCLSVSECYKYNAICFSFWPHINGLYIQVNIFRVLYCVHTVYTIAIITASLLFLYTLFCLYCICDYVSRMTPP